MHEVDFVSTVVVVRVGAHNFWLGWGGGWSWCCLLLLLGVVVLGGGGCGGGGGWVEWKCFINLLMCGFYMHTK